MNILHINSYFSTSGLFKQLYDRQVKKEMTIDVYVPISYEFPKERLAASGDYTNISRNHPQWSRWIFPIKHHAILHDLKKRYKLKKYDLIHAHSLFSNGWLAFQLNKMYRLPYIVSVRNADLRTFFQRMPWMRRLGVQILKEADHIIFISQNTCNEVFEKYIPRDLIHTLESKTSIIPNGVDDYWHDNLYLEKEHTINQPIQIVSTGKVMRTKLFVPMAEKLYSYSQNNQPVQLHIIGPTWEEDVLKELEAIPIVTYHGKMSKEEMRDFYRHCDIFALLSSPETFGLVYVEAMSQGLPVIYTKGEGFDNFFPDRTIGVSVDLNSQQELAEAIDFILADYDRLSTEAMNKVPRFNWEDINQVYFDLYKNLIRREDNE